VIIGVIVGAIVQMANTSTWYIKWGQVN